MKGAAELYVTSGKIRARASMLTTAERPVWSAAHLASFTLIWTVSCAVFSILLLSLGYVDGVPKLLLILLLGMAALAAWKPDAVLIGLAAAIPVATWTGRWWHGGMAWPEVLVVAFAVGFSARTAWNRQPRRDRLQAPIFLFSAVVITSLMVRLLVLSWTIGGAALWDQLLQLTRGDYFVASGGFPDLDAAMRFIEGMVLLRAAYSAAQSNPAFSATLMRWLAAGATAAAALNLWRLWEAASRLDSPLASFVDYLMTLRYNVHYGDLNAAGSYFVMTLIVTIGLIAATRRVHWVAAAICIATSAMLSGSRTALLSGAVIVIAWTCWRLKDTVKGGSLRSWTLAAGAIVLVGSAVSAVAYVAMVRNYNPSLRALNFRVEFAKTTLRMVEDYPAFGIGIGQYPGRSSSYSAPGLLELFGSNQENAHNNFLQVLGELGVIGLAAFLWLLWTLGRLCFRVMRERSDPLPQAAVAGVVTFILTWLAGHPLLIDEPAFVFWLLLGATAGWVPAHSAAPRTISRAFTFVVLGAFVLATSIPARARQQLADADLEHRGIGLSAWHHGDDGVRYRLARSWSTIFVPSSSRLIVIPLRAVQQSKELVVSVELDGRPADVVRVPGDRWYDLHVALPAQSDSPRFSRLELRVEGELGGDDAVLKIGKVEAR